MRLKLISAEHSGDFKDYIVDHSAVQYILGVRPELEGLRIEPCIPSSWPGFEMQREFRGKTVNIRVTNPRKLCRGVQRLVIDGTPVDGSLAPLSQLREGSIIDVEISG